MASSDNMADQVANAAQNAVKSGDFSDLQSTIERVAGAAAESIGRGIAQASDGIRRGQEQYALIQERKRKEKLMNLRYASATTQRGGGIALVVAGVAVGIPLVAIGLIMLLVKLSVAAPFIAAGALFGGALVFAGTRKIRLAGVFERYRNAIGLRESCSVKELAQRSSESVADVQKNVRKMLAKGMFKQATLDEASGLLLMTPEASESHERELAEARRAKRQEALVQSASSKESAPLTAEQQQLLDRGKAFIAVIREGNDAIPDEEISRTLDRIEHVVSAILDAAAENPELIDDLDRLLDYYLPTTVKLLETYRELDSQPIQSDNIVDSKREIEKALDSLSVAFEKLLDSLFRDVATDVSSDITVLRTVLAQEGLTESPFDKAR